MAAFTYNAAVTDTMVTPITSVYLSYAVNNYTLTLLRKNESECNLEPILEGNDAGGETAVGYILKGKVTLLGNNFEDMIDDDFLTDLTEGTLSYMYVSFGLNPYINVNQPTVTATVKAQNANFKIIGTYPFLKIEISFEQILSIDVFNDTTNPYFHVA